MATKLNTIPAEESDTLLAKKPAASLFGPNTNAPAVASNMFAAQQECLLPSMFPPVN